MRALAIALFYALGTALGGIVGPWLFGVAHRHRRARRRSACGYAFGAALMLIAAAVTVRLGVAAERRSLEDVARPLSCVQ